MNKISLIGFCLLMLVMVFVIGSVFYIMLEMINFNPLVIGLTIIMFIGMGLMLLGVFKDGF